MKRFIAVLLVLGAASLFVSGCFVKEETKEDAAVEKVKEETKEDAAVKKVKEHPAAEHPKAAKPKDHPAH
ncbi:MAG: hypothetical protein QGH42_04880 [Kiritimatiellia bacterium]|jgi:protein involved in sex pheromone biosynthesis|nr:hypothetical protein [Kiritimatiellia bacterium]MDP6809583.1 hypothetical protein [Kiritimatiellia bacterium]MDP7023566.1 hypothetical protein [Kiritimatiellia bacterium]